jgi:uncharacterized protein (TIGR02145 family)
MKFSRRILSFLLIGVVLLACEEEQATWLSEMEGKIVFANNPNVVGAGLPVTFTIGGISTPGNVSYTWEAPGFEPSTFTGASFDALAPEEPDTYSIIVTAKATGYRDVVYARDITVIPCMPMQGVLTIKHPMDVYRNDSLTLIATGIISPAGEQITYTWETSNSSTFTGATFTTKAPGTVGTYTISVTANAPHYCDTTVVELIDVKDGRTMDGTLTIDIPDYIAFCETTTFIASGISAGNQGIEYDWTTFGLFSGTPTGNSYTTNCLAQGSYSIGVTASATGYSSTTTAQTFTVGDKHAMEGSITITVPPRVVKGTATTFSITNGVTNPPSNGISFRWSAPGFSPDTHTGETFFTTPPTTEGAYTITVTAEAHQYQNTTFTKVIEVKGGLLMEGSLDFGGPLSIVKGQSVTFILIPGITTPANGITYSWTASGLTPPGATGNSYTATCTDAAGAITVTLTATAPGYSATATIKPVSVTDGKPMQGAFIINGPESVTLSKNANFTITNNITDPLENVTFAWDAPAFLPTNTVNPSFSAQPNTLGPQTITVRAKATGYQDKIMHKPVYVNNEWSAETFTIHVPDNIVKDLGSTFTITGAPGGAATYEWSANGFNPSAHTGETFATTPSATGSPTIRLTVKTPGYASYETSTTVTVKELEIENLRITASDNNFRAGGNNITFSPNFTPLDARVPTAAVSYTWSATNCLPNTSSAENYTPALPSTPGSYNINLTVKAPGYKQAQTAFTYTVACNPMTVSFTISKTDLLAGDETTLRVIPPSPAVPNIHYTWTIPEGFTIPSGSSVTSEVTIKAPISNLSFGPVTITLTANAVNYCPDSEAKTITVKSCLPLSMPEISSSNKIGEFVKVPSRSNVAFYTQPFAQPLQTSSAVTYTWRFEPNGLPFTPSSLTGNSTEFFTVAPAHNTSTYTLTLQVSADGYCDLTSPATQKVVLESYIDQLRGTIIVKEAMKTTNPSYHIQDTTIWLAKGTPATLTAMYSPASGEQPLNPNLSWRWTWIDDQGTSHELGSGDGNSITFTPQDVVDDQLLVVEATDKDSGKQPASRTYRYTVQDCNYSGNDLRININSQCGTTSAGNFTAFIKDAETVYRIVQINNKWWFAENLKRTAGSHSETFPALGYFYSKNEYNSTAICPAGWHIPDLTEWNTLKTSISTTSSEVFTQLILNNTADGPSYNGTAWAKYKNVWGDNQRGFSAIPAGYLYNGSILTGQGLNAYFLMSGTSVVVCLGNCNGSSSPTIGEIDAVFESSTSIPSDGTGDHYYTVRCVRNL